jgi:hypothetical protein
MRLAVVWILVASVLVVGAAGTAQTSANDPGTTVSPLLSCPNVDGSPEGSVLVPDILAIVRVYFHDWPNTDYYYLYDLVEPYNLQTGTGGLERINDILAVVDHYFDTCPLVDTQVAQATR